MKKFKFLTLSMCVLTIMSCSTKAGSGSLIGAGGGAVLGGIIGNIIGKDSEATAIGAAIGGAVGAGTGALIGRHMDKVAAEAAAQVQNASVEQVTDANGLAAVKVTFDSGILFATNKYDLNANSKAELAKFAEVLKNNTDCYVDVYGHTDSSGCGVSAAQIKNTVGKGSSEPVADNSTKAGKQQNRRVEVYMYASPAMIEAANAGTLQ